MATLRSAIRCLLLLAGFISAGFGTGEFSDIDIGDAAVIEAVNAANAHLNDQSNSMYRSKVVQITKAERQVVAGILYKLEFSVAETSCRKGRDDGTELDECAVINNNRKQKCKSQVWVQSWLEKVTVKELKCGSIKEDIRRDKPLSNPEPVPMPGGSTKIDENSEEVKAALNFAIDAMNQRHHQPKRAMISDVISVKSQVVSGIRYHITLQITESRCLNTEENMAATLSRCPIVKKPEIEECKISVIHAPWRDVKYELLDDLTCTLKANPLYYKALFWKNKSKNVDAVMDKSYNEVNKPKILGGKGDYDFSGRAAFSQYVIQYNKSYKDRTEKMQRYKNFKENMKKIQEFNEKEQGTAVYGATEFADLSEAEWRKLNPIWDTSYDESLQQAEIPNEQPPASFDWRDHDAVTEVKNQGSCGSCWAFSTTGNIEGQWAIKKKQLISLSEQELVDCDKLDEGCDGGLPTNAYKEIRRIGGLDTEKKYPYEGEDEKCAFKPSDARVYINGSLNITKDEEKMAAWLAQNGPISIGINAAMMQFYFGGVSHPWKFFCSPESLDHGVLIVGYGTKEGYFSTSPYWIVKNSWGASWGEKGYYLVYRGDGTCGLNQMCTSAVVN